MPLACMAFSPNTRYFVLDFVTLFYQNILCDADVVLNYIKQAHENTCCVLLLRRQR